MPSGNRLRERLIELVRNIQDSRDRGGNDAESLAEFNRLLPGTDIDNLCNSDYDVETIVDIRSRGRVFFAVVFVQSLRWGATQD